MTEKCVSDSRASSHSYGMKNRMKYQIWQTKVKKLIKMNKNGRLEDSRKGGKIPIILG